MSRSSPPARRAGERRGTVRARGAVPRVPVAEVGEQDALARVAPADPRGGAAARAPRRRARPDEREAGRCGLELERQPSCPCFRARRPPPASASSASRRGPGRAGGWRARASSSARSRGSSRRGERLLEVLQRSRLPGHELGRTQLAQQPEPAVGPARGGAAQVRHRGAGAPPASAPSRRARSTSTTQGSPTGVGLEHVLGTAPARPLGVRAASPPRRAAARARAGEVGGDRRVLQDRVGEAQRTASASTSARRASALAASRPRRASPASGAARAAPRRRRAPPAPGPARSGAGGAARSARYTPRATSLGAEVADAPRAALGGRGRRELADQLVRGRKGCRRWPRRQAARNPGRRPASCARTTGPPPRFVESGRLEDGDVGPGSSSTAARRPPRGARASTQQCEVRASSRRARNATQVQRSRVGPVGVVDGRGAAVLLGQGARAASRAMTAPRRVPAAAGGAAPAKHQRRAASCAAPASRRRARPRPRAGGAPAAGGRRRRGGCARARSRAPESPRRPRLRPVRRARREQRGLADAGGPLHDQRLARPVVRARPATRPTRARVPAVRSPGRSARRGEPTGRKFRVGPGG